MDTATAPAPAARRPVERLAYSDRDLDAAGLLSRKTRYRLRRAGRFPEPVTVGGRKLYSAAAIRQWLADPENYRAAPATPPALTPPSRPGPSRRGRSGGAVLFKGTRAGGRR